MSRKSDKVQAALQAVGAVLVRTGKHHVYRLPNGRQVVLSCTASDHRAEMNKLADIRRAARN